jgi:hypothetical protein
MMSDYTTNPDARVRARVAARGLADTLFDMVVSEMTECCESHEAWGDDYGDAFFHQLRKRLDGLSPPPEPPPRQPCPICRSTEEPQPLTEPILIDEDQYYVCQIDGDCERNRETDRAVLIRAKGGEVFWVPKKCLGRDEPDEGDEIDIMRVPGFKIIEDHLEHLVIG